MGGRLSLRSEVDVGTTFELNLPMPEAAEPVEHVAPSRLRRSMRFSFKILVAEDNVVNQNVIKLMLGTRGIVPKIVSDGQEAVDAFKVGDFDLVLMDIQMPVLNGEQALKAIRIHEEAVGAMNPVPVVALTANALEHQVENYLALGFETHISKPIAINHLFNVLESVIPHATAAASVTQ